MGTKTPKSGNSGLGNPAIGKGKPLEMVQKDWHSTHSVILILNKNGFLARRP